MSWVRLDDQFPNHAKIMAVGSDAFRLHVTAMCWSASQLTDGVVPAVALRQLGWFCENLYETTAELEAAGLWEVSPGGWTVHDYLDYNPSREQVTKERESAKERMQNKRRSSPEVRPNISRTSDNVQLPPSPSPSPSERDEGIAAPITGNGSGFPDTDPEWAAALSKLEHAKIGSMTGAALLELGALWPDLTNGRRAWLDDAIRVAQASKASSPVYALRVLSNAIRNNERPGQTPERKPSRNAGHTAADLDAIFGVDIHGNPV